MHILALSMQRQAIDYAVFGASQGDAVFEGEAGLQCGAGTRDADMAGAVARIRLVLVEEGLQRPHTIAIRAVHGGQEFSSPVIVTDGILEKIAGGQRYAAVHTAMLLSLIRQLRDQFAGSELVVVFETALFARLPARESTYALDLDASQCMWFRRYGFHGIFHRAAAAEARRALRREDRPRIISMCVDAKPELAAIVGFRPVMVTGGLTPLDGIPGETSCGHLDPNVVLTMANDRGTGPEIVDVMLGKRSGLLALAGQKLTMDDVFSGNMAHNAIREFIFYRILLACGEAIAAMGGIDVIVLSGSMRVAGREIGLQVRSAVEQNLPCRPTGLRVLQLHKTLLGLVADEAAHAVLPARAVTCASRNVLSPLTGPNG